MNDDDFFDELEDLVSAEDFLEYFDIPYEPAVVHVNRLHILQRFHDYVAEVPAEEVTRELYAERLERAYSDFIDSDARTERVLKIYKQQGPQTVFVPLSSLRR